MVGKEITVNVTANEQLNYYSYHVISQRKIIYSKSVYIPDNTTTSHEFTFAATRDLAPDVTIIVFILKSDAIISDKLHVQFEDILYNSIDISLSSESAQPGDLIDINVKTNPNSYVGLLGIDQSILLLKSGNDLSLEEALNNRKWFYTQTNNDHNEYNDFLNYWDGFRVSKP